MVDSEAAALGGCAGRRMSAEERDFHAGGWRRRLGTEPVMGTEFQFGSVGRSGDGGGDGCATA